MIWPYSSQYLKKKFPSHLTRELKLRGKHILLINHFKNYIAIGVGYRVLFIFSILLDPSS